MERANIITLAGLISVVSLADRLVVWLYNLYNPPPFGIYDMARGSAIPFGVILSMFTIVFVVFARKYYLSLVWSLICLPPFLYEFVNAFVVMFVQLPDEFVSRRPALDLLFLVANPLDYLIAGLLFLLALWQVSLIIRGYSFKASSENI